MHVLCEKRPSSAAAAAGAAVAPSEKDDPSGVGRLDDMFEPKGPVSVLMDLAEKEAKVEEDRGADARSPLLQALVQVSYSSLAPSYIAVAGGRTTGVTGRGAHTGLRVFVLSKWSAQEVGFSFRSRTHDASALHVDSHSPILRGPSEEMAGFTELVPCPSVDSRGAGGYLDWYDQRLCVR